MKSELRRLEKARHASYDQSMVYLRMIDEYLSAVERVAKLTVYQRLFSSWHVLHVPSVALLIVSAHYGVLAVHMY